MQLQVSRATTCAHACTCTTTHSSRSAISDAYASCTAPVSNASAASSPCGILLLPPPPLPLLLLLLPSAVAAAAFAMWEGQKPACTASKLPNSWLICARD